MDISTSSNGAEQSASYGVTSETPNSVHITIGSDAKNPGVTRLKELSIRLAYTHVGNLHLLARGDIKTAITESVAGLRDAGVSIASDIDIIEEASR